MKKRGGRFLVILGAGLAAMAFVVVYIATSKNVGTGNAATAPTPPPMVSIAVVNQDIPAYTVLDATNVGTVEVDPSTSVAGTSTSPAALYGQTTLVPYTKGQPILTSQLTTQGFSNIIEKGKRAYTLAVQERNTFGGAISENDSVDVLWTHEFEIIQMIAGPDGKPVEHKQILPTTKTLLQDVKVLRVISLRPTTPPNTSSSGTIESTSTRKGSQNAVTTAYATDAPMSTVLILAVNDQQSEVLKLANGYGTIDLALRSSAPQKGPDGAVLKGPDGKDLVGDHDLEKTTGITTKVLVESYGLLLPEILVK